MRRIRLPSNHVLKQAWYATLLEADSIVVRIRKSLLMFYLRRNNKLFIDFTSKLLLGDTLCPRSLVHFYIAAKYIKTGKTFKDIDIFMV